ncbi:MAG: hypothetical protein COB92_06830 [Robiginitomaculum sp.]|nr:MAG: hypothetical protein COB92_06830 [Robiginitomaculum sp.]
MGNLLFSPSGRIDAHTFKRGAVILLTINVLLWQAWLISLGAGVIAFFASLVLVYCWGCLFAKRFHDASKSGWMYLLIFIIFLVVSYMVGSVLLGVMSPDIVTEAENLQETIDMDNPDVEYLLGVYDRMLKAMSLPFTISYLAVGGALAFGVNAMLKTDPEPNEHGDSGLTFD